MKISDENIDHLAHLARLEFEGGEKEEIKNDLNRIISFMEKLSEINTDAAEPLIFMTDEVNRLREDIPAQHISKDEALMNAAKKDSDYFRIPKVLKK